MEQEPEPEILRVKEEHGAEYCHSALRQRMPRMIGVAHLPTPRWVDDGLQCCNS